ncbi:MAG TPA: cupin domain-containing protein [Polyangiaceae bacterium]|nr:cupin domain-containing protein [Polyangiaceae bacterium]
MSVADDPLAPIFGMTARELFAQRELFVTRGGLERFPVFMRTGPLESVDSLCRFYTGALEVAQGSAEVGIQIPVRDAHAAALLQLGLTVYFTELRRSLPFAGNWLKALENALGVPECASLAAFTNAKGSGLPLHHDRFDQVFFQLKGKKIFRHAPNRLAENPDVQFSPVTAAAPEFGRTYQRGFPLGAEDIVRRELTTLVLEPGDAFFMPAGTWHTTAEQEGESLSMVVVVRAPSRLELLLNLLDYYVGQAPEWRGRTYGGWADAGSNAAERDVLARLTAELARRLPALDVQHAFDAYTAHGFTIGTVGEYPRATRFERFIRLPNSSARVEASDEPGKLRCVILSGPTSRPQARTELAFNVEARPVLDWVLGLNRAFTLTEASARFEHFAPDELAELFAWLGHAALIRPLPMPEWDGD